METRMNDARNRLKSVLRDQYGITSREADRQINGFARHHRLRADNTK